MDLNMQAILDTKEGQQACDELIDMILSDKIKNQKKLEKQKVIISRKYNLNKLLKNADLIVYCERIKHKESKRLIKFLQTKPVRTMSGVSSIAVMWLGEDNFSCPFSCTYCPQGPNAPKSYIGVEPTTLRAIRNNYDPYDQVTNRLKQFKIIGHPTDKCELIIMGGTYLSWSKVNYENFVKRCYDAFNEKDSKSLEESMKGNEKAPNRVIGLTIETRADYCRDHNISEMLRLGTTRVEIGVQSTDAELLEKTNRGHGPEENKKAFKKLKEAGLKITAHWMPGLTGVFGKVDIEREINDFKQLFSDPDYRPDELKIYPTLVIPGTELHKMWEKGEYAALSFDQTIDLLIEMKKYIPKYVRVKRIMRDISEHEASAGARTTNLRQLLHEKMKKIGVICNCIRCREVGHNDKKPEKVELVVDEFESSGGKEFFISFEDVKNNLLIGFIRLRIDDGVAKIRELHVYGKMIQINKESDAYQHSGYGKQLLDEAERIAKKHGKNKIQVTSGVGVREYYKKFGYELEDPYMVKKI